MKARINGEEWLRRLSSLKVTQFIHPLCVQRKKNKRIIKHPHAPRLR